MERIAIISQIKKIIINLQQHIIPNILTKHQIGHRIFPLKIQNQV